MNRSSSSRTSIASPRISRSAVDADELRSACRLRAASRSGGIVAVTFGGSSGVPVANAISKFSEGPGHRYQGTVMVRFRDALYSVTL